MLDYVRSGYGPTTFSVMVLDTECYGVYHYAEYIVVPVLIGGKVTISSTLLKLKNRENVIGWATRFLVDTRRNGQPPKSQLTKKSTCKKVNPSLK